MKEQDNFQEVTLSAIILTDYQDQPMTAYYLGNKEVDTDYGESLVHEFQKEDGKRLTVWGFTVLDKKLSMVQKGTLVRVTYTGKEQIKTKKYGLKDVHTCKVEIDPTKSIADKLPKEDSFKPVQEEGKKEPAAAPSKKKDDLPF